MSAQLAEGQLQGGYRVALPRHVDAITSAVAAQYGRTLADLRGGPRHHVGVRNLAMHAVRCLTGISFPAIAAHFGLADHSTVMLALRDIEERKQIAPAYMHEVQATNLTARTAADTCDQQRNDAPGLDADLFPQHVRRAVPAIERTALAALLHTVADVYGVRPCDVLRPTALVRNARRDFSFLASEQLNISDATLGAVLGVSQGRVRCMLGSLCSRQDSDPGTQAWVQRLLGLGQSALMAIRVEEQQLATPSLTSGNGFPPVVHATFSAVAARYGIEPDVLCAAPVSRDEALQVALFAVRQITNMSNAQVGAMVGFDHTTVYVACRTVAQRLDRDEQFGSLVRDVIRDAVALQPPTIPVPRSVEQPSPQNVQGSLERDAGLVAEAIAPAFSVAAADLLEGRASQGARWALYHTLKTVLHASAEEISRVTNARSAPVVSHACVAVRDRIRNDPQMRDRMQFLHDMARSSLQPDVPEQREVAPTPPHLEAITAVIARHYGIAPEGMRGADRRISPARQVAMYAIKQLTGESIRGLARFFDIDRSTVTYSLQSVERRIRTSEPFASGVERILNVSRAVVDDLNQKQIEVAALERERTYAAVDITPRLLARSELVTDAQIPEHRALSAIASVVAQAHGIDTATMFRATSAYNAKRDFYTVAHRLLQTPFSTLERIAAKRGDARLSMLTAEERCQDDPGFAEHLQSLTTTAQTALRGIPSKVRPAAPLQLGTQDDVVRSTLETVATRFGIPTDDLTSGAKFTAHPRQIAMYLLRERTSLSFPDIADRVGLKDHSSAMYAQHAVAARMKSDPRTRSLVNEFMETLAPPKAVRLDSRNAISLRPQQRVPVAALA